MSNIVIRDLVESMELDIKAMKTIMGGSRSGGLKTNLSKSLEKTNSLIMANVIGNEKLRSIPLCPEL